MRRSESTADTRARRWWLTASGCSSGAQCPPGISTSSTRLGAASAILRAWHIGSSRSLVLPITRVGTVRPDRSMWRGPISLTSTLAHAPRPAGGVAANRSCTKSAIAGSASAPTAIIATKRRLPGCAPRKSGAPPKVSIIRLAASARPPASMPGTRSSLIFCSRSPVVVLISATAAARSSTRCRNRSAQDEIAIPPIECPPMTARSPGRSVAASTASRSPARCCRL